MPGTYSVTGDSRADWHRNIVSLRNATNLFADLVDDPVKLATLIEHEMATKPATAAVPIVNRPFEDAEIYEPIRLAIAWPFEHPLATRYSNGSYGVWYGAATLETCIRETVHHFRINTLASAAAAHSTRPIYQERRVYLVHCNAMLVDLRAAGAADPRLTDPGDYSHCQTLGAQLRAASLPGVLSLSARHRSGRVAGVFVREALSNPRDLCYLNYTLDSSSGRVEVERKRGAVNFRLDP